MPTKPKMSKARIALITRLMEGNYGAGPWAEEPDIANGTWGDFVILVVRNDFGILCGYVGVPRHHPLYGKHKDAADDVARVHGGVTFSGRTAAPGLSAKAGRFWYFGFDCAHAGDYIPKLNPMFPHLFRVRQAYRDLAYVAQECLILAKQLRGIVGRGPSAAKKSPCARDGVEGKR